MSLYDYVIAIDFGTTTTAWAIRKNGENLVQVISPISNTSVEQKTPSDIHVFLQNEKDPFTRENSQLGTFIQSKFKQPQYQFHYHFAFYKMEMYKYKPGTTDF